tara:strand:+ start:550 stop:732 length:183 start_codon:yes stop_codon:yes gene_type:complete
LTLRRHLTPPEWTENTFSAVSAMVGTTPTPDKFQGFLFFIFLAIKIKDTAPETRIISMSK